MLMVGIVLYRLASFDWISPGPLLFCSTVERFSWADQAPPEL
jgi:hypothetical protein